MTEFTRRFEDPFADLVQRLWERSTGTTWPAASSQSGAQRPSARFPVNIYEDGSSYYMTCMAPGLHPESIDVTAEGNVLTVSGTFEPQVPDGANVVVQEMGPVQFRRQFTLGAGLNAEGISASYENGMLHLVLSKAQQHRSRRIPVSLQHQPEHVGSHSNT